MKKLTIVIISICLSYIAKAQTKDSNEIINYIEKTIKQHVVFVSWTTEGGYIKVTQLSVYDFVNKKYIDYTIKDIEKKYPNLLTLKTNLPTSSTIWGNVDNINGIDTVNFINNRNILVIMR